MIIDFLIVLERPLLTIALNVMMPQGLDQRFSFYMLALE